jgi:hypothetical protein
MAERPTERFRKELLARLRAEFPSHAETPPAQRTARDEQGGLVVWPVNPGPRTVAPRPRRGADDLVAGPAPTPSIADEKTQLVRMLRQRLSGHTRLAVLVGVAAGALAISGVSLASTTAVPGDTLYSVKSLGERARLFLAGSDADRGRLHLDFARMRLVEAHQVGPEAVAGVLAQMDDEITEGVRLLFTAGVAGAAAEEIESVATFVQQVRADLIQLQASVQTMDDPARESLDLLTQVEIRANELRAALADGCEVTEVDTLGPKPTC